MPMFDRTKSHRGGTRARSTPAPGRPAPSDYGSNADRMDMLRSSPNRGRSNQGAGASSLAQRMKEGMIGGGKGGLGVGQRGIIGSTFDGGG